MGCDIHPAIEVNVWANDEKPGVMWDLVAIPDRDRCYEFFNHICGVRGDGPGLWPNRGKPADTDWMTNDIIECGEHSHSWWTLAEMESAPSPESHPGWEGPKELWDRWLRIMRFYRDEYGVPPIAVRVVVSFDN